MEDADVIVTVDVAAAVIATAAAEMETETEPEMETGMPEMAAVGTTGIPAQESGTEPIAVDSITATGPDIMTLPLEGESRERRMLPLTAAAAAAAINDLQS